MRVLLLTLGSRGDVEPFIALGLGLRAAGHAVTLCTSRRFGAVVAGHGLRHAPMDDAFVALLESSAGRAGLARSGSLPGMLSTTLRLMRRVGPMQEQVQRDCWAAAQACRPDLIVHHLKILGAPDIAQQLGVPAVLAPLVPMVQPTAGRPCPVLPAGLDRWFGAGARRAGYRLVNTLATRCGTGPVQRWRHACGLPPRPHTMDLLRDAQGRPVLLLHGHSEVLLPRPADWPAHAVATGWWHLPPAGDWRPPPALQAFLDAGPPPVYVGFGSMAGRDPAGLAQRVVEALARAGLRGVLARGWGGLQPAAVPGHVHLIDEAPHDRLLPLMAAVVHHGGAGTTAAGLRAGRPTVVCPFFGDQPFWGRVVHDAGLGPAPLPQRRLTPARLAAAMRLAVESVPMRQAAATVGARLRAEDGVARAVAWLEAWQATGAGPPSDHGAGA
ncbi:glycosyltransferase [Rubrivivax sp. RP6-9]|uniref:glycosyltransferase n=1 Tax=Rubrivivax sp. RP6-9 TaxID=3415750 RepID=UPI003CC69C24